MVNQDNTVKVFIGFWVFLLLQMQQLNRCVAIVYNQIIRNTGT